MSLNLGYWSSGGGIPLDLVAAAEELGFEAVWAAEAYGSDAVTVLSWVAARTERIKVGSAIMQMPARTPAMTAMTAATLDRLSGGRFLLGLGMSGPQVVEGWHGVPYGKPLAKTREYIAIVRSILARRHPLVHDGGEYQIPYRGEGATGLGKPLKLITHPLDPDLPIYLAAIGPRNVALAAELADGWLPIFYSPERAGQVFAASLAEGFRRSGQEGKEDRFDVAPAVTALLTDDPARGRELVKPGLALYIGGMGARGTNFYHDLVSRYGYGPQADRIQDLYLAGHKAEAVAAVPDQLVDETSLIGNRAMIRDRLQSWTAAGIDHLLVAATDVATLRTLAELAT